VKVGSPSSLESGRFGLARESGGHAVVITGLRNVDGVPHFILRNSHGYYNGVGALPLSESCRISSAYVLKGPQE